MTEIEKLLTEYNINPRNTALIDYYHQDNLWKTLRIERDENRHSAFLKWFLEKDSGENNSPLIKFFNLLVRNSSDKNFNKNLKRSVLTQKLRIRDVEFSIEKTVNKLSRIRYADRLDLYTECEIDSVDFFKKIEIIVENKVDSSEGGEKVNIKNIQIPEGEEDIHEKYRNLKQTQRYYYACSAEHQLRNSSFDGSTTCQLFVFLTAREQKAADEHFISITYQDLVDYVIQPYLKSGAIDEHTKLMLTDYLRILGNPYNENMTTMAITQEERELLKDFYKDNVAIFKKALEVMKFDADDDEANDIAKIITAIEKKRPKRQYTINDQDNPKTNRPYTMYEVLEDFIKFRLKEGTSIEEID